MIKKIITFFVFILSLGGYYYISAGTSLNEDVFQEAINRNFKPIDDKAELFLYNLNKNKNYCFGSERKMTFVECSDYIEKIFSINSDEFVMGENGYAKACEKSLQETIDAQENKLISAQKSKVVLSKDFSDGSCYELYKFKLDIFKSVAYDILEKNKYAILKDEHKKYTQEIRKKSDKLTELFRVNLGYIERLWKKWPSKTKK